MDNSDPKSAPVDDGDRFHLLMELKRTRADLETSREETRVAVGNERRLARAIGLFEAAVGELRGLATAARIEAAGQGYLAVGTYQEVEARVIELLAAARARTDTAVPGAAE